MQGGYILIHDYNVKSDGFTGVKRACDSFFSNLQGNVYATIEIPETTHIIVRKNEG